MSGSNSTLGDKIQMKTQGGFSMSGELSLEGGADSLELAAEHQEIGKEADTSN